MKKRRLIPPPLQAGRLQTQNKKIVKMNIKTKNTKPKTADSLCSSLPFWFCIISFSFSPFFLPASAAGKTTLSEKLNPINLLIPFVEKSSQDINTPDVTTPPAEPQPTRHPGQKTPEPVGTAPVNFASQLDKELPQRSFTDTPTPATNQNKNLTHQLWLSRITFPKIEGDEKNKEELQKIIDQISSVELKPLHKTPQPFIIVEPPLTAEPQKPSDTGVPQKGIKPKPPYEPITDQTLQIIRNLSQHPDRMNNPFELAEVLFLSGHLKEAAPLYAEALNRKDPNETASAKDRAWILLQIANCLRNDDPPTAAKMYKQLIADYPESPWTDLARAQEKLIKWYQKDNPKDLTKEYRL